VYAACRELLKKFLDTVADDVQSPLRGSTLEDVVVAAGHIQRQDDSGAGESYTDILNRRGIAELTAHGSCTPPDPQNTSLALAGPFAAKFVEIRVDADLGLVRVARVVSAVDGGRILNEKLARSQIIGGTVGGIGQAIFEETITDAGTGRIANATFGDYLVPVNADVPDIEVIFVGEPDPLTPIGTKGVGEIGLPGIGAAIANAIYHATGRRIRSLPITIDKLL
jgi:xanthine dehydrogenase YagR molybdenum-binding subunit